MRTRNECDEPAKLLFADDFGGYENARDAAVGQGFRFAELRAADADGAAVELHARERCGLVRLCVRAQLDAAAVELRGHRVEISFDHVEVEQEGGRVDLRDVHQ